MRYGEWLERVPCEITNDPIWNLEVYRLALFAADIGWNDAEALSRKHLTRTLADQLCRSLGSISANLTEGYSRSKGPDRARFFEIALGSARESRDWYFKARQELPAEVVSHRLQLTTKIIGMLTPMILHQRRSSIRETQAEYLAPGPLLDDEIPLA